MDGVVGFHVRVLRGVLILLEMCCLDRMCHGMAYLNRRGVELQAYSFTGGVDLIWSRLTEQLLWVVGLR